MSEYDFGNHRVYCEICGQNFGRKETLKNWKNQIVCREDYETQNPQEKLKIKFDPQRNQDMRPRGVDFVFVDTVELMKKRKT